MSKYSKFVSKPKASVPSSVHAPIKGREQDMVVNSSGSFTFDIGEFKQLDRFLILGAAGPSYYASQKALVLDNVDVIKKCIAADGVRVVNRVVEISQAGRAPKNDPALFTLALVAAEGDVAAKTAAYAALPKVARTGTHLLHFTDYANDLRGWGRGLKKAVANWFNNKDASKLALQVVKYKQRDGWSMRDVLRVSHPKAPSSTHNTIYHYVTKGWDSVGELPHPDAALNVIWAAERAKNTTSEKEIAKLVSDFKLPWEAIDTKWLNSHVVWDALMENIMPEALMRNLGRLTSNGYLSPMSAAAKKAVDILTNEEKIKQARLHPLKLLVALKTYQQGRGDKGSLTWSPNQNLVNALDDAHYMAYKYVEPTGKRILLALDVSGSMAGAQIAGMPLDARSATAAMAMMIAKTEQQHMFVGFSRGLMHLPISPRQRLDDVVRVVSGLPFDYTNISLPFTWALQSKTPFDAVIVMTDNEVNAGVHPSQALNKYRKEMGLDTKLVVVGTSVTKFSVADPKDDGSLDVVGFDTAAPAIITDFIAGRFDKAKSDVR